MTDYYEILGIRENADQESIKRAYRSMAKKFHPDRNKEPDAEEKFKKITEAYDNIGDPSKRKEYDNKRNFKDHFFGGFENFNKWNQITKITTKLFLHLYQILKDFSHLAWP